MAQDWDIKSRGTACRQCENPFEDMQPYVSILTFEESGYIRGDYCSSCWDKEGIEKSAFSMWQGVFRLPPAKPEDPVQKENAESLLRKLIEDDAERHINVIYILAVMLERKRILEEKDVKIADGLITRIYEHRKSGETFVIPDPQLRLDELEHVQEEVIQMLEGDKPEEPEEPETTDETQTDPSTVHNSPSPQ
jgi:hypothetical protein